MKKAFSLLLCLILLTTSCATIVSKSTYPVRIDSTPKGANFVLEDLEENAVIQKGKTPMTLTLDADAGFFTKGKYRVAMTLDGHHPGEKRFTGKLDPWYFGNIIFGGLLGLVIIDPATGAMWKLPKTVHIQLQPVEP